MSIAILEDALFEYGHSLDIRGRSGRAASPPVATALRSIREEFAKHVYCLPASSVFYRARIETESPLEALSDIRPPPPSRALAGRANVMGQRVLYVADTQKTAIAEIRPALADTVVVASLVLQREARVLDLVDAPTHRIERYSAYEDPSARRELWAQSDAWLNDVKMREARHAIGQRFARAIRPHDTAKEYLTTQFLARLVQDMGLDGIAYGSAQQSEGFNYVFFDPLIAEPDQLQRTRIVSIQVQIEEPQYVVWKLISPPHET